MTCAASKNKEMKNFVSIGKPLVESVEHNSDGVEQTAGSYPYQTLDREGVLNRTDGDYDEPAHQEVDSDRENSPASGRQEVLEHAGESQSPDSSKKPPSPDTSKGNKC